MGTKKVLFGIGIAATLYFIMGTKTAFGKIVKNQAFRGLDGWGSGAFGASRGKRKHQGVDIIAKPNETVFAPITGKIIRPAPPYPNDLSYTGLLIENDKYAVKMFYAKLTVPTGTSVKQGEPIAKAQNIAAKYSRRPMINHVHFEVRDKKTGALIDPTNMFTK